MSNCSRSMSASSFLVMVALSPSFSACLSKLSFQDFIALKTIFSSAMVPGTRTVMLFNNIFLYLSKSVAWRNAAQKRPHWRKNVWTLTQIIWGPSKSERNPSRKRDKSSYDFFISSLRNHTNIRMTHETMKLWPHPCKYISWSYLVCGVALLCAFWSRRIYCKHNFACTLLCTFHAPAPVASEIPFWAQNLLELSW